MAGKSQSTGHLSSGQRNHGGAKVAWLAFVVAAAGVFVLGVCSGKHSK